MSDSNVRKSRSPNVSCEVSRQIGLIIRPKPYSNGRCSPCVFALIEQLRCSPCALHFPGSNPPPHNFSTFTSFKKLLKCYREDLRVSSRESLVITHKF